MVDEADEYEPETIEQATAMAVKDKDLILSSVVGLEDATPKPARVVNSAFGNETDLNELPPEWTLKNFQEKVKPVLKEYFIAMDIEGTAVQVRELLSTCPSLDEFGVLAMRAALDAGDSGPPLVVKLIVNLHRSKVVDTPALVRSFEKLFCTWEDISLDVPRAPQALLAMLNSCVDGGAVKRSLLMKIPENLLNAGLQQAESEVSEMLMGVAAELKTFKKDVTRCLEEYFVALNAAEVETFLTELNMQPYQHEFVKKAITLSFTQPNIETARNAVLELFSHLSRSGALSKDDLQWGVTRLLGQLDDLALDCPKCVDYAVEMCSLMVADELLSVPFLRRCRLLRIGGATGLQVIDRIQRRTPEYSKRHLNTAQFKRELQTIIFEYFNSGDQAEVGRCISDISPLSASQSAEIIRKIMVLAMERSGAECELALKLIIWLVRQEELDADAVEAGFDEMYQKMADTVLDVPDVHDMALSFVVEAKKARVLPEEWTPPAPLASD
jgi:hypothetical protein